MQSISGKESHASSRCPDCKMCLQCSENRCAACRGGSRKSPSTKMSIRDQIALYERLNPHISTAEDGQPSLHATCACMHGQEKRLDRQGSSDSRRETQIEQRVACSIDVS